MNLVLCTSIPLRVKHLLKKPTFLKCLLRLHPFHPKSILIPSHLSHNLLWCFIKIRKRRRKKKFPISFPHTIPICCQPHYLASTTSFSFQTSFAGFLPWPFFIRKNGDPRVGGRRRRNPSLFSFFISFLYLLLLNFESRRRISVTPLWCVDAQEFRPRLGT